MSLAKKLLDLKEKIEAAKIKKNRLEGQREGLLKSLKTEFDCTEITQAKELLKSMEIAVDKESKLLDKQIDILGSKLKNVIT